MMIRRCTTQRVETRLTDGDDQDMYNTECGDWTHRWWWGPWRRPGCRRPPMQSAAVCGEAVGTHPHAPASIPSPLLFHPNRHTHCLILIHTHIITIHCLILTHTHCFYPLSHPNTHTISIHCLILTHTHTITIHCLIVTHTHTITIHCLILTHY